VATGFAAAGVYAFSPLCGHDAVHNRRALTLTLAPTSAVFPLLAVSGDLSALVAARFWERCRRGVAGRVSAGRHGPVTP
jgi:hypothetical protein